MDKKADIIKGSLRGRMIMLSIALYRDELKVRVKPEKRILTLQNNLPKK